MRCPRAVNLTHCCLTLSRGVVGDGRQTQFPFGPQRHCLHTRSIVWGACGTEPTLQEYRSPFVAHESREHAIDMVGGMIRRTHFPRSPCAIASLQVAVLRESRTFQLYAAEGWPAQGQPLSLRWTHSTQVSLLILRRFFSGGSGRSIRWGQRPRSP